MRVRPALFFLLALTAGAMLLPAAQKAPAGAAKVKVVAEQANLREKPDIGSSIVQQIPEGTVLDADKKEGEWYFVRYALEDGGVIGGWIHESLVEVVSGTAPVPQAAQPPAAGAPPPAGSGAATAAGSGHGSFPLEISFSIGPSSMAPRDLNDGTRGYVDWYGASIGIPAPSGVDILHLAVVGGVELSYSISPRLAVGLAVDGLSGSDADTVAFVDLNTSETLSTHPSVSATPVKATARYYPGAGFYLRAALGVYSVRAGYVFRHEYDNVWEQWKGTAKASALGGEAAFGGEWRIAARTAVFVEAGFRMASFSELTGESVYTNSAGESLTEPGTLYFFHKTAGGSTAYPIIAVRASEPAESGVVDARRAEINISGTALRVGVRYRF
jgi:hypothetical protein